MDSKVIRLVIADDYAIVRAGLEALFASTEDLRVVAVGADPREALAAVLAHRPDVVVVDAGIDGTGGAELTRCLRATGAACRVVIISRSCDPELLFDAIQAGAVAYMLEDSDPAELLQAVRAAAAGYALFSPRVAKHILSATTRRHPEELTARARQVLVLLGQGLTNQLIARRLGISEKTVKGHLTSIFVRIGVTDRVHAALWAQERRQWLEAG